MKKILLLMTSLFIFNLALGQNEVEYMKLSKFGYQYKIKVTLPEHFNEDNKYPVLYYLDADFISDLVSGSRTVLKRANYIDDIILVGITIEGNEYEINKQRIKYFTPSKFITLSLKQSELEKKYHITYKSGTGENAAPLDSSSTGDGKEFLKFLFSKVIPSVEKKYPIQAEQRTFLGHSFGALFGTYTLIKKPDLFRNYILISGSLSWNEGELLDADVFQKLKESSKHHNIYLTYGTAEPSITTKSNDSLNNVLNSLNLKNINLEFKTFKDLNHHSILSRAIYDGTLYVYKKENRDD